MMADKEEVHPYLKQLSARKDLWDISFKALGHWMGKDDGSWGGSREYLSYCLEKVTGTRAGRKNIDGARWIFWVKNLWEIKKNRETPRRSKPLDHMRLEFQKGERLPKVALTDQHKRDKTATGCGGSNLWARLGLGDWGRRTDLSSRTSWVMSWVSG